MIFKNDFLFFCHLRSLKLSAVRVLEPQWFGTEFLETLGQTKSGSYEKFADVRTLRKA